MYRQWNSMGQVKVDPYSSQGNQAQYWWLELPDGDFWLLATLFGTPQTQLPSKETEIYMPHPTLSAPLKDIEHTQVVAQAPGYGFLG